LQWLRKDFNLPNACPPIFVPYGMRDLPYGIIYGGRSQPEKGKIKITFGNAL